MSQAGRAASTDGEIDASAQRDLRALELMTDVADRTGLTTDRPPDRYLWTDAFAVCNFLALGRADLALRLVGQVHDTLGRYAPGDVRLGSLSGLDHSQAAEHPTIGGLRIGKRLPERQADEPFDERLEWERDGQYFHYLTKWMHALDQVSRWTGRPEFNRWARELAATAYRRFTYVPATGWPRRRRMHWKMSVDLTRPLVASMGHHDPLDGYITCQQLRATAMRLGTLKEGPGLAEQGAAFEDMMPSALATGDLLGIGGLLADAWRVAQLTDQGAMAGADLRDRLLDAAASGLASSDPGWELSVPASSRLAFRELGLSIGLAAVARMREAAAPNSNLDRLVRFISIGRQIEAFWMEPDNQRTAAWLEHQNINEVMLATSLMPAGYLTIPA
jgi:hypothetical protein